MKTTAFDPAIATDVENAVMKYFGCERHDIIQYRDSEVKKVVVFILFHHFGFNKRIIGWNYKMTHWYVPTAADEVKQLYEHNSAFKEKIDHLFNVLRDLKVSV
jgi:hypothetical protein